MKRTVCLALFTAVLCFAQATAPAESQPPPKPAAPVNLMTLPAGTLVATIDGQKILAGDLQAVLRAFDPQQQKVRLSDLRTFLDQFALMMRLSGMAEKAGLD